MVAFTACSNCSSPLAQLAWSAVHIFQTLSNFSLFLFFLFLFLSLPLFSLFFPSFLACLQRTSSLFLQCNLSELFAFVPLRHRKLCSYPCHGKNNCTNTILIDPNSSPTLLLDLLWLNSGSISDLTSQWHILFVKNPRQKFVYPICNKSCTHKNVFCYS